MDLQMVKARYGTNWARTGALVLFVVTGLLLVATLVIERSRTNDAALSTATSISALFRPATAG